MARPPLTFEAALAAAEAVTDKGTYLERFIGAVEKLLEATDALTADAVPLERDGQAGGWVSQAQLDRLRSAYQAVE
jgi:hypothetical protein